MTNYNDIHQEISLGNHEGNYRNNYNEYGTLKSENQAKFIHIYIIQTWELNDLIKDRLKSEKKSGILISSSFYKRRFLYLQPNNMRRISKVVFPKTI